LLLVSTLTIIHRKETKMNKDLIDHFLISPHCPLSSVNEDIIASLSILKRLWRDKKVVSAVDKTIAFFDPSVKVTCEDACKQCNRIILEIVKHLHKAGLDQVFFNLLVERQYVKNNLQQYRRRGKTFKKHIAFET
jgi:hypothetical protein